MSWIGCGRGRDRLLDNLTTSGSTVTWSDGFGTRSSAAEGLIAELTSAFFCAHLGITGELRHAGYVSKWIEMLKHDDHAIFTAAAKAQKAVDFLCVFSEEDIDEAE